jgi:uracil-DNA glycosylase family 4
LTLELESTPDILADVALGKGDRVIIGFAAETENVAAHARAKLESKQADVIVANDVTAEGAGFDHDTNIITLYLRDGSEKAYPRMPKIDAAHRILDQLACIAASDAPADSPRSARTDPPMDSTPTQTPTRKTGSLASLLRRFESRRVLHRPENHGKTPMKFGGLCARPDAQTATTDRNCHRAAARPRRLFPPALPIVNAASLFEAIDRVEGDTLERIREDLGECTRCRLHKQRNKIVFGAGNPRAELVFVGEGPGHDEDMQGLPFVGPRRKTSDADDRGDGPAAREVYICNVVKCRPPENRKPEDDEVATCSPYLYRQLDVIAPKAIVCLGGTAAQAFLKTKDSISRFRGTWFDYRGTKLLATYHPAYLLRNPAAKSEVWKDLQKVMAHLGLKTKKPS